jgi:hypothetical protein
MPTTTAPTMPVTAPLLPPASSVQVRQDKGPFARLSTPAKALVIGAVVVLCALMAVSIGYEKVAGVKEAIHTIAYDTKPSVVSALQIRGDLGTMDAEATNEALGNTGEAVGLIGPFLDAARRLEADYLKSAENVTFGEAEREPLRRLARTMTDYEQAMGRIQSSATTAPAAQTRSRVRGASDLLNSMAVPASEDLEDANLKPLTRSYDALVANRTSALESFASVALLAAAVLAAQLFAFRRLGQTLATPASVLAGVLVIAALVVLPLGIHSSQSGVQRAKTDAFDSVLALSHTKAVLDRMNALESLWLYTSDPVQKADTEKAFNDSAALVLRVTDPGQLATLGHFPDIARTATDTECRGDASGAQAKTPLMQGLLGDAMKNITYGCAERTPLTAAVVAFLDYLRIDRQIRSLEAHGDHAGAVALCIGNEQGQSNWAFDRVEAGLTEATAVNDHNFTAEMDGSETLLSYMSWLVGLLIGGTALLQCLDLWIRTRDYR